MERDDVIVDWPRVADARHRSSLPRGAAGPGGSRSRLRLVTSLPLWAVYVVAFGSPLAAFAGVVLGHYLLRKGANELDVWRRREETMRMLRWAAEQAVSSEPAQARAGVAALEALSTSELLQEADETLVDAILDSIIQDPVEVIEQAEGEVEVIEVGDILGRERLDEDRED